jgi:hypothetical protein
MATKYGFSDVRDQLTNDVKSAYPTKWEDFRAAKVLGEDIFGSPKPHPNAVLNLFLEQSIRFALPFAAYRASVGGFSALMSEKPGTVLPRTTLVSTVYGMERTRSLMAQAAREIAHEKSPGVCSNSGCALNVSTKRMEQRMEVLKKLHDAMIDDERKGGMLNSPPLGGVACARCTPGIESSHAIRRRVCWELLPATFSVAESWGDV